MTEFVPADLLPPALRTWTADEIAAHQRDMRRRRTLFFVVAILPVASWARFRTLSHRARETGTETGDTLWLGLTVILALVAAALVYRTLFCPACGARLTRNRDRRCTNCDLPL